MKRISWIVWAVVLAVVLAGCAAAQRGAIIQARESLDEGDYKEALRKVVDAEKYTDPPPELQAEMVYLRAEAYEGLGRKDEAVGALKYVVDKFPDTSYAYQAKEKLRKLVE
jgi:outer membrane protein assembly factor BamD (BamD/ComL family)